MKKLILSLILIVSAFASFGQAGAISQSGIFLRVNDSTTYQTAATSKHAAGYSDIYFNNQATTPHFDIWNGSTYSHVFNFNGGSGSSGLTVGTTAISSGTTTRVLYDNAGTLGEYIISGTGNVAMTTSPVFTTPNIGTATGSITGNAATVTTNANLTGHVTSTGNAAVLGAFSSSNLLTALTDETGSGLAVFGTSPTLVTPVLGTPSSVTLTNATGLPISTGLAIGSGTAFQELRINSGATAYENFTPISYPLTTIGDLLQGTTAGAPARLASVSAGSVVMTTGVGAPLAHSITKWPNAATVNQVLYATATDTWGGSSLFTFNGTRLTANYLTLVAGTATTGTAPIAMVSGPVLTTISGGKVEFNDAYYASTTALNRLGMAGKIQGFTTAVNNTSTTETDLFTYTTKASTLAKTDEEIEFTGTGTLNDITSTAQIRFYFAGTSCGDTGALTVSATGGFTWTFTVKRTGSTTATASVMITTPGASTAQYTTKTDLTGLTFTNTNIIKITGTAAGASGGSSDITASIGKIIWWPAAAN